VNPDASTAPPLASASPSASLWLLGLAPLVLLGALIALIVGLGPMGLMHDGVVPPVERLAITQVTLAPGRIDVHVLNDGPDDLTIAQVAVDDAFWMFEA
jgi:ZIP family zinc transporter